MHPLAGRWIANIPESRRHPNHQFESATMRFEIDGDMVSLAYGGVNASGHQEQATQRLHADGQERVVPEAPDVTAISTLDERALHMLGRKNGLDVGRSSYRVSEDGRRMTATVTGVDAAGESFDHVIVFDRES